MFGEIDPAALYRTVGFVLQDVSLLGISVRDNIILGRPDATDAQVEAAARAAHITTGYSGYPTDMTPSSARSSCSTTDRSSNPARTTHFSHAKGCTRGCGGVIWRVPPDSTSRSRAVSASAITQGRHSQIAVKGTMFVGSTSAHFFTPVVANITSAAVVVIGLCLLDWRIGLVCVVGAVVLVAVLRVSSKLIADAEENNTRAAIDTNGRILEFARSQPVLRAFGSSGTDYAPLATALDTQYRVGRAMMWRSVLGIILNGFAVQMVFTAVLGVGAWMALDGRIEAPLLIAIFGLAARFIGPVSELADLGSTLRMADAEIARITGILDSAPMPQPTAPQPVAMPGALELDSVSFGYDDQPVLREVSFGVAPGSMTALVGPSGSGKTTISRLIARFYDVDAGVVRVGGVDVRDQDTATLMGQLSLVFQDVYLFDDTLIENIRLGRPDATDDDVRAAARTAGVTSIVDRLPQGWETRVGEGGSALSGGERQRVSIARALLKNAPIVLFDEATSALDPENEAHVAQSIRTLADTSTVLVIAHRLSTVIAADQIVVLTDDGHVDDIGTHAELLDRGGQYARFWAERSAAAGWTMAATRR